MKITGKFGLSAILFLLLSSTSAVFAQGYELGLLVGRMKASARSLGPISSVKAALDGSFTYQVNFASRMVDGKVASLHWEVLLTGVPKTDVNSTNLLLPRNYSTIFLTPGVKLKIFPVGGVTPYIASGFGYGHYSASNTRLNGQPNMGDRGNSTFVFNFGGGVDFNILRLFTLRGEIRDFITGNPQFNAPFLTNKQHNVLVAGGIVLRF